VEQRLEAISADDDLKQRMFSHAMQHGQSLAEHLSCKVMFVSVLQNEILITFKGCTSYDALIIILSQYNKSEAS
jgi:hypothetical protein